MVKNVLCVCTGNSCRSVMAAAVLERLVRERQLPISVGSAGVSPVEGMAASRETQEVLRRDGLDVSGHRARYLTDEMIEEADVILVMEMFHRARIVDRVPSALSKVELLAEYGTSTEGNGAPREIPDPIGQSMEVYETCYATIRESVERVVNALEALCG